MDAAKVDMFMMMNSKYFESYHLVSVRERLLQLDESKWATVQMLQFKDPTTALIISIVAGGHLGIDRFYIGDTGLGIAKLLTCGGLGIWAIVDWFLIQGATREKNMQLFQNSLY
ncbi:MAG: TM2 domain-containing protein [Flavobacterium sp.]|jgi:TM2 domain-containing membrane protein YozV